MSFNLQKIQSKVLPVANKISSNRYLKAITNGLVSVLPAIIVGSLFSLIGGISIDAYQKFLKDTGLNALLTIPVTMTTNIIALLAVFFIAYNLTKSFKKDGLMSGLLALVSFLIVTPLGQMKAGEGFADVITFDWLGSRGLFVAIIVGLVVGRLYVLIVEKGLAIKMPEGVPEVTADSFNALIPGFIIIIIFLAVNAIFKATSFGNIHQLIYTFVQQPLQGLSGTYSAFFISTLLAGILWFFGIHGGMVILFSMMSVLIPLDMENIAAYAAGTPIPNIMGFSFLINYANVGGFGCTLGLALLMAFRAKSKKYDVLGKIATPAGIFGINEPIIFGFPMVLNPLTAIPFIFAPIIIGTIAYVAIAIGLVPHIGVNIPMNTPFIVSGFLLGGWRGVVLQVVQLIVSVLIYLPFFNISEKAAQKEEEALAKIEV